jgi:small subunit ribosomal protein S1
LDENPWEAFDTLFSVGSEHEGTILKIEDKSAIVALPYGVEGYAPLKQLLKEDKKTAKEDETLNFKVTEFNKENRRIVLSHTALWKEEVEVKKEGEVKKKEDEKEKASKAAKKLNDSNEKSTFGDIGGLAELKAKMEGSKD